MAESDGVGVRTVLSRSIDACGGSDRDEGAPVAKEALSHGPGAECEAPADGQDTDR